MAKQLINCLTASHARELRELLDKSIDETVSDKNVRAFMKRKISEQPTNVERAQLSTIRHAERWLDVMDYQRPANMWDVKRGRATEVGQPVSDPQAGLERLISKDRYEIRSDGNLDGKHDSVMGEYMRDLAEMVQDLKPKHGIVRNRAHQDNMIRALYGDPNVPAKYLKFADKWTKWNEKAIERFNDSGGRIGSQDGTIPPGVIDAKLFNLPLDTNWGKLKPYTFSEWIVKVKPWLDLDAMGVMKGDHVDIGVDSALRKYFDDVKTDGMSGYNTDNIDVENSFTKRHKNLRFLQFKDSDGWLNYSREFSKETPYSAMMDHVTTIARETGTREMFGPSYQHVFRELKAAVVAKTGNKVAGNAAQKAFDNATAKLTPVNKKAADFMQAGRNVITGLKLPGAMLAAMPDTAFSAFTSLYNGLPVSQTMKHQISALAWNSAEDQIVAAQLGFVLDHAIDSILATGRYADVSGKGPSSRFSDFIMRGGGLSHWTTAHKQGFWMSYMQTLAGKDLSNANLQRAFKRYNISAADQALMKKAGRINKGTAEMLDPFSLERPLREKITTMVNSEMGYAVPEPDSAVKGFLNQGYQRGTFGGEVMRSGAQFKAFTASILFTHGARSLHGFEGGGVARLTYLGGLIASTTVLGTGVVQLKEIARGNKPRDWDTPELWYEGMLAGGVLSIAGDIILSDADKYGQSAVDFFAGPLAGEVNRIMWKGLIGNSQDIIMAEKTYKEVIERTMSAGMTYVPGQFWYLRLAFDRGIKESAQKMMDPSWSRRAREREMRRRQEPGANERWWK